MYHNQCGSNTLTTSCNEFDVCHISKNKSMSLTHFLPTINHKMKQLWSKWGHPHVQLLMRCQLTKVIGISFFIFQVSLHEGFSFMVDCCFGFQYWLQLDTTCSAVRSCTQLITPEPWNWWLIITKKLWCSPFWMKIGFFINFHCYADVPFAVNIIKCIL